MNIILTYLKSIYKFIILFIITLLFSSLFYYFEILDLKVVNIINYILASFIILYIWYEVI